MSDKSHPIADQTYRRLLKMVVAALCKQAGFDHVDQLVLESLTEMLTSYLIECGRSSRLMAELCGRTQILPIDVTLALLEMGFSLQNFTPAILRDFGGARIIVPGPRPTPAPTENRVIRVGKIRSHPSHIPDHMPPFPDPHTYVRTQPQIEYQGDYECAREAAATQQRNLEMSLIKFMLKIEPNICLHVNDTQLAVLKPRNELKPYLSALLPSEEELKNLLASTTTTTTATNINESTGGNDSATTNETNTIDNPYLRPIKMPRGGHHETNL